MEIDPNALYIDRRLGYHPSIDKELLKGRYWIKRGTDEKWLVPVQVNEYGFLIESTRR